MTFKKTWKKLMAKETTTTFTVTVTHPGAKMGFGELFGRRGRCKSTAKVSHGVLSTATKAVPAKSKYTPEQKVGRLLLKEACELGGLKYSAKAELPDACFNVRHATSVRHQRNGRTMYNVVLKHGCMHFDFQKGVGSPGKLYIRKGLHRWQSNDPTLIISFADPKVVDLLSKVFAKWGKGSAPIREDAQNEVFTLEEFVEEHVSI